MSKKFIAEYKNGDVVDEVFLLAQNELKMTRAGALYLHLLLADRSGRISARMWDASEVVHRAFNVDDFVHVKGRVETYQNELQIVVKSLAKPDLSKLHLSDFLPRSERDPDEMFKELSGILATIEDPHYAGVVKAFLDDEEFCKAFRTAPAATALHHAYLGGLLEHTLSLARLALAILPVYPTLRRDLLLAGILLHDAGKTRELGYKRTFQYTDPGQLVGHVVIGVLMLEEKVTQMSQFPSEKLNLLRHLIVSHHGEYEFGSPKLPMIAEAVALHYLDNLDAKLQSFAASVAEDRSEDSGWTEFNRSFQRRLYKK